MTDLNDLRVSGKHAETYPNPHQRKATVEDLIEAVDNEIKERAGADDWPAVVSAWSVVSHFLTHAVALIEEEGI